MTAGAASTNATIFYHPDGFDTGKPRLMGRQSAGEGFLRAWVRHSGVDALHCCTETREHADDFAKRVRELGATAPMRWAPLRQPQTIAETGCLFYPSPDFEPFAWRRRRGDPRAYSLCGITHTTASHVVMEALGGLLTAPVQDWDAVICVSKVVRDTAVQLIEARAEYLRERVGATSLPLPQLPIIPLGIDTGSFDLPEATRATWRQKLGIGDADVAVLYVGRLSYHGKAHPLPMYLALERAAQATGKKIHLVQAGWFANEGIEKAFRDGAAQFCPSVNAIFLDGREAVTRREIWAAGDIFTSLSDNVQETFGLTPVEAMAAGLPVVVSDWNGYRETVRDGIDGFRIPTMMPPAPLGTDLARRYDDGADSYDTYSGLTSQLVSVDVAACTDAYTRLVKDPVLRKRMGNAGRLRARGEFEWKDIIRRYQELWRDLAERRVSKRAVAASGPRATGNPTRPDPFAAFASYPTAIFSPDHEVALQPGADAALLAARRGAGLFRHVEYVFPSEAECATMLEKLAAGPCRARELVAFAPPERRGHLLRALVWLQKLDIVRLTARPTQEKK